MFDEGFAVNRLVGDDVMRTRVSGTGTLSLALVGAVKRRVSMEVL